MSREEKEAVISSVQEFQLGENSEGKHLHRLAREYAERNGDEDYLRAVEYFRREEQRHAQYLRAFLTLEGYGTVKLHVPDARRIGAALGRVAVRSALMVLFRGYKRYRG